MTKSTSAFIAINLIALLTQSIITTVRIGRLDLGFVTGGCLGLVLIAIIVSSIMSFVVGAFKEGVFWQSFNLSYVITIMACIIIQFLHTYLGIIN